MICLIIIIIDYYTSVKLTNVSSISESDIFVVKLVTNRLPDKIKHPITGLYWLLYFTTSTDLSEFILYFKLRDVPGIRDLNLAERIPLDDLEITATYISPAFPIAVEHARINDTVKIPSVGTLKTSVDEAALLSFSKELAGNKLSLSMFFVPICSATLLQTSYLK